MILVVAARHKLGMIEAKIARFKLGTINAIATWNKLCMGEIKAAWNKFGTIKVSMVWDTLCMKEGVAAHDSSVSGMQQVWNKRSHISIERFMRERSGGALTNRHDRKGSSIK